MKDTFCSHCGTKFTMSSYPRTCGECKQMLWANPIPVVVTLVPVRSHDEVGLLVIRRSIEPQLGKLALPGGFLEEHESCEVGSAREVLEETGIIIDPSTIVPMYFASSHPTPNRVLLFSMAEIVTLEHCVPFVKNGETSERGLIFGPEDLEDIFSFPRHLEVVQRYFSAQKISGKNRYTQF